MNRSAAHTVIVDERDERIKLKNFNMDVSTDCHSYMGYRKRCSEDGKLTFQFRGTAVELHGYLSPEDHKHLSTPPSSQTDDVPQAPPSGYLCVVDGVTMDFSTYSTPQLGGTNTDVVLCGSAHLDPSVPHTLELIISDGAFVVDVDYILYQTSYDNLRDGDMLYYHAGQKESFRYSSISPNEWFQSSFFSQTTTTDGASVNYTYYGSQSTLYGTGRESNDTQRTGQLSITPDVDSGAPLTISSTSVWKNGQTDGCSFYPFYQSASTAVGNHSIMVEYTGTPNSDMNVPFEVSFFTVPARNLPSHTPPSDGISPIGILGVLFGVAVIVIAAMLVLPFLAWRRRQCRRNATDRDMLSININPYVRPRDSFVRMHSAALATPYMDQEVERGGVMNQVEQKQKQVCDSGLARNERVGLQC